MFLTVNKILPQRLTVFQINAVKDITATINNRIRNPGRGVIFGCGRLGHTCFKLLDTNGAI